MFPKQSTTLFPLYLLLILLGWIDWTHHQPVNSQTPPADSLIDWVVRVNLADDGAQANHDSNFPRISEDGNTVVFASMADNLVPHDNNGIIGWDIFAVDLASQTIQRVSVSSIGEEGNGQSTLPQVSGDGRYVLFQSNALNFVTPDINGIGDDIFLHDRQTGITELVSVSSTGEQGNYYNTFPAMSDDARYIAFDAGSLNLVPDDTNDRSDVFVHDRLLGITERVSVSSAGGQANGDSSWPDISNDGRYVVFNSMASNLVAGDSNGDSDIFLHDRLTHTTELISLSSTGEQGDGFSFSAFVSDNGQFVVFASRAMNLVNPGTGDMQVFLRDRLAGTTELVTVDWGGSLYGAGESYPRAISADGRYVLFDSRADNLVLGDMNGEGDTFIRDRQTKLTILVGGPANGEPPNGISWNADFLLDQQLLVYISSSTNLVEGDSGEVFDVFVARWHFHQQFLPLLFQPP